MQNYKVDAEQVARDREFLAALAGLSDEVVSRLWFATHARNAPVSQFAIEAIDEEVCHRNA